MCIYCHLLYPSLLPPSLPLFRIVVSAPKVTVPDAQVENTGAVYTCPIVMGMPCEGLVGSGDGNDLRLYDKAGELAMLHCVGGYSLICN